MFSALMCLWGGSGPHQEAPPHHLLDSLDFCDSSEEELELEEEAEDDDMVVCPRSDSVIGLSSILEENESGSVSELLEKQKLYRRYPLMYLKHFHSGKRKFLLRGKSFKCHVVKRFVGNRQNTSILQF